MKMDGHLKTLCDRVSAMLVQTLLWLVVRVIAGAIKLHSLGPVLYAQHHAVYSGQSFVMYKFCAMRTGRALVGRHALVCPRS